MTQKRHTMLEGLSN